MSIKVFIDGSEGTTGLRLADRLKSRTEIELLDIDPALRKDAAERARIANSADIVFLCLPDAAARESVAGITNPHTRVIDASTAHRIQDGWAYGLPELSPAHREAIISSKRVAVPGCYATGFAIAVYPLVKQGLLPADYRLTCFGLSGYSGGGKTVIEKYRDPSRPAYYTSPRQYALGLKHKHLPEMQKISGLMSPPVFSPVICDIYAGMTVTIPLFLPAKEIHSFLSDYYAGQKAVYVADFGAHEANEGAMLDIGAMAGLDTLELCIAGSCDQAVLISRMDNLGKGASGAAVQCMNLMCGFDEMEGLQCQI
ncbi:MAG: N-acetyl-gamma-glutamyl-phosphate reductase [Oscillospiraceae bacterium]|nr:N-acetyl-gamma-glutamyl-phosphate reductase [Oscillospiraceae bacterium]